MTTVFVIFGVCVIAAAIYGYLVGVGVGMLLGKRQEEES